MKINKNFWKKKKVFITGHTGFKGTWLSLYLQDLGAKVYGYALKPNTSLSLYKLTKKENLTKSFYGDLKNIKKLKKVIHSIKPDLVFHLAAQPIVSESYKNPTDTFKTNINGTINIFDIILNVKSVKAIVNVTSDKCYENLGNKKFFKESDPLGGLDPYSASKACSEIISKSYYNSFIKKLGVGLATARAGNIIGGGDWSKDRLIPDIINSINENKKLMIRYPNATRPWQYVLDPLTGYILLAQKLYQDPKKNSGPWNFGPHNNSIKKVNWIVSTMYKNFGVKNLSKVFNKSSPHESANLSLNSSKAKKFLGWKTKFNTNDALKLTANWYQKFYDNIDSPYSLCISEIKLVQEKY